MQKHRQDDTLEVFGEITDEDGVVKSAAYQEDGGIKEIQYLQEDEFGNSVYAVKDFGNTEVYDEVTVKGNPDGSQSNSDQVRDVLAAKEEQESNSAEELINNRLDPVQTTSR